MDKIPTPEWVKLIPENCIPVFLFDSISEADFHRLHDNLTSFFGERKFLVLSGTGVQLTAIATPQDVSAEGASWAMEGT